MKPANLYDLFSRTRGAIPYEPAQRFLQLHTIQHHEDRAGNGDDVFNGNTQVYDREAHLQGRDQAQSIAEYEKNNEDLVAHIQQAHKAVAARWLAAAQASADSNGENALSRLTPVISQMAAKY